MKEIGFEARQRGTTYMNNIDRGDGNESGDI